jgi:hypothetical protein
MTAYVDQSSDKPTGYSRHESALGYASLVGQNEGEDLSIMLYCFWHSAQARSSQAA